MLLKIQRRLKMNTVNLGLFDPDCRYNNFLHERDVWKDEFFLYQKFPQVMVVVIGEEGEVEIWDHLGWILEVFFRNGVLGLLQDVPVRSAPRKDANWKLWREGDKIGLAGTSGFFNKEVEIRMPMEILLPGLVAAGVRLLKYAQTKEEFKDRFPPDYMDEAVAAILAQGWTLPEQPPGPLPPPPLRPPTITRVDLWDEDASELSESGQFVRRVLGPILKGCPVVEHWCGDGTIVPTIDLELPEPFDRVPMFRFENGTVVDGRTVWFEKLCGHVLTGEVPAGGPSVSHFDLFAVEPAEAAEKYAAWWGCEVRSNEGVFEIVDGRGEVVTRVRQFVGRALYWAPYLITDDVAGVLARAEEIGGVEIVHCEGDDVVLSHEDSEGWVAVTSGKKRA